MKVHTNEFKDEIKKFGRQLDSVITYRINGVTTELGVEELNSVTPHYEANILKSVMKQLDIDSNIDIPLETEINYKLGVLVNGSYEYVNFGNYIVYSSQKQEDLNSYKIVCYDKMLNSMIPYENLNITYPITIKNYINTICQFLNLSFKNINDTFPNYNKVISRELYLDSGNNSLGYTFRDVFDELAQVTGSTICINEVDNQLELRYINNTNDTINAEYLKDINVNFKEKYGPINSIVLSRSAESDNVYLRDETSISENGLCELKIVDNQIMNWNDRSDYLPDLLSQLGGLEYYLNDFVSTGITYYNMCDKYTVNIEDNYYSCVMFNDEVLVTQGLEENIHTDMPKETKTDYTKADKTDRKINQTYLLVDKQNQEISAVVRQTTDPSNPDSMFNKVTSLNLRVGELESKISDVADLTISGETSYATLDLNNINASEPIMIKVHPTNDNISYLYPRDNLYPSDTLYMTDRIIRFYNNTTDEYFDYTLPDDLLIYDSETYDEFYLNFDTTTCQVIKRCGYNADGTVNVLANEITTNYTYPTINLTDGNYTISLLGYNNGYLFTRLLTQNIYTTQFYTRAETNSIINQTSQSINLSVDTKLSNYSTTNEMNSAITLKANEINSVVSQKVGNNEVISRINQTPETISIDANKVNISGVITAINNNDTTTIDGNKITTGTLNADRISGGTINANNIEVTNITASNINRGTLSGANIEVYNGTGFLKMLSGSAYHPYVSALNIAGYASSPSASGAGISFRSSTSRGSTGNQVGYISYGTGGSSRYHSSGNMNVSSNNFGNTANGYYRASAGGSTTGSGTNSGSMYLTATSNIFLAAQGILYGSGGGISSARIVTTSGNASSKNVKDNIIEFNEEEYNEALNLLNNIKIYNYDYKYNLYKDRHQYGFIIDEIENLDNNKFFKFETEKAKIDGDKLDFVVENIKDTDNIIEVKKYDSNVLDKYLLTCLKAQQMQIDLMKNEIKKLKKEMEEIKNGKN